MGSHLTSFEEKHRFEMRTIAVFLSIVLGAVNPQSSFDACALPGSRTKTFGGRSYTLYPIEYNWYDAEAFCKECGGHLASIHSKLENDFIYNEFMSRRSDIVLWLAGVKDGNGWIWSDETDMDYVNWGAGQPNNWLGQGVQDRINMQSRHGGGWDDGNGG